MGWVERYAKYAAGVMSARTISRITVLKSVAKILVNMVQFPFGVCVGLAGSSSQKGQVEHMFISYTLSKKEVNTKFLSYPHSTKNCLKRETVFRPKRILLGF